MEEIIKLILFFIRAESIALTIFIAVSFYSNFVAPKWKYKETEDIKLFYGMTTLAFLATSIYAWFI